MNDGNHDFTKNGSLEWFGELGFRLVLHYLSLQVSTTSASGRSTTGSITGMERAAHASSLAPLHTQAPQ